jgi:phenylalanyl-tRNA synthetase beta chain
MNILAPYNWIRESVKSDLDAREFARRISLCGPAVERIHPQAVLFDKMVVGRIMDVQPHPNADKLRLVSTDIGGEKPLTIVCGGSNLESEQLVAVALVGAKVRWHGEGDLIELVPAVIRGIASEGMICGANEIGLADAFPHAEKEIMDLSATNARPGTPLATVFDMDDTVFDIEVTTNRPDAFSMTGLAREAAAILDMDFTWKEPEEIGKPKGERVDLTFENRAPKLCTRYQAVAMSGVKVGRSPWWIMNRLRMAGIRPINNVVDATNYVMLELGQPMHAFDHAKLRGGSIVVRTAVAGEKMLALDGNEYALSENQLVIADAERPVAVAGIMGGEETGVTEGTTAIVLESATFEPVSVRRTGRALNLHSDSSLRFEKGLPEEQTSAALARAVELIREIAGGEVASRVIDDRAERRAPLRFPFRPEKATALIGVDIPEKRMVSILESLGFAVEGKKGVYEVTVPYWRARDIEDERDFAEEIARVIGYHELPSVLPSGTLPAVPPMPILGLEDRVRAALKGAGYTELLTYSFVPREALDRSGNPSADALAVANPLSKDFEVMRTSLVPGMLMTIAQNEGLFPHGACFEVGNVYLKREGDLPSEDPCVIAALYGDEDPEHQFRQLKGALELLCKGEGLRSLQYARAQNDARWHPGRTVSVSADGRGLGVLGEVHPDVTAAFGIRGRVTVLKLDLASVLDAGEPGHTYAEVPQFPSVLRDLAVVVDAHVEYAAIEEALRSASVLLSHAMLFDVYRGAGLPSGKKSVAVHLEFTVPDRTLRSEEIDAEMEKIVAWLGKAVGATVRS